MDWCKAPLKCFLFIINVLFWLAGGTMLYAGIVYIQGNYGSISQVNAWPAVILLCSATVLILGGLVGCCGAIFEKKACLGLFLVFLASVLIVQASISGVMFTRKVNAQNTFDQFLEDQFKQYGNMSSINDTDAKSEFNTTSFIDESQKNVWTKTHDICTKVIVPSTGFTEFKYKFVVFTQDLSLWKCCGLNNYTDWQNSTWSYNDTNVPISCCKPQNMSMTNCTGSIDPSQLYLIYTQGCKKPIDKDFHYFYDFLNWTAVGLAILIFLGSTIVIGLLCHKQKHSIGYSHLSPQYTEA